MLYVGYEHSIDNQREDRFLFRGLRTKAKEDNIARQSGLQFSQRLMYESAERTEQGCGKGVARTQALESEDLESSSDSTV